MQIICLSGRLLSNHQVHGSEQLLPSTSNQAVRSQGQTVGSLLGASRSNANALQYTGEVVSDGTADLGHPQDGEYVAEGLDVLELAAEGPVPGGVVDAVSEILVVEELEAGSLHGVEGDLDLAHVGNAVTLLDTETDLAVVQVVVVVVFGHEPFVHTENTAGLEDTENLRVDAFEGWCVDGGLNGVDCVESVIFEGHLL